MELRCYKVREFFSITLDNDALTIAKVAKSYDPLVSSNLLTVKIHTENIRDLESHQLLQTIVEESFSRGHEYEITRYKRAPMKPTDGWSLPLPNRWLKSVETRSPSSANYCPQ